MPATWRKWKCKRRSTAGGVSAANSLGTDGAFARIRHADGAANANSEVLLPIDDMMEAKLVLTDALISQSLRKSKLNQRKGD